MKYKILWVPSVAVCVLGLLPAQGWAGRPHSNSALLVSRATVSAALSEDTGATDGDTLAAQLATITTDTGAFAVGHRDFRRYDTPGYCLAAAFAARRSLERSVASQLLAWRKATDTAGLGATAVIARTCGSRFTLGNTPTPELRDLFELALYAQNDTLAAAVLARLVAAGRMTWENGMHWYLDFGRLAAADALLAQADAKGPSARSLQLLLHEAIAHAYYRFIPADSSRARQEDERILDLVHHITARGEAEFGPTWNAYTDLMEFATLGDTTQMATVAWRAKRDLDTFKGRISSDPWTERELRQEVDPIIQTQSLDTLLKYLTPSWYREIRYGGRPLAPRMQADAWFPAPGHAAADTVAPVAGKVNLICGGGEPSDEPEDVFQHGVLTAWAQAAHIRDWLARYGSAGLVVTVVRAADGSPWIDYGVQRTVSWPMLQAPAEEAAFWHWYDQIYHALPVTEAVVDVPTTTWLPPPDERRMTIAEHRSNGYLDLVAQVTEHRDVAGECVLVDRDGTVLINILDEGRPPEGRNGSNGNQPDWDKILAWLFVGNGRGHGAGATSSPRPSVVRSPQSLHSGQSQ